MPSYLVDMCQQLWRIQSSICQDDDCIVTGNAGANGFQHVEPVFVPSSFGVAFGDSPCYWDGTTTVDYAYAEDGEVERKGSGIQSDGFFPAYSPRVKGYEVEYVRFQAGTRTNPFSVLQMRDL